MLLLIIEDYGHIQSIKGFIMIKTVLIIIHKYYCAGQMLGGSLCLRDAVVFKPCL